MATRDWEPTSAIGIVGHILGQCLDRHVVIEAGVAGTVDLTHSAAADRPPDDLIAESLPFVEMRLTFDKAA